MPSRFFCCPPSARFFSLASLIEITAISALANAAFKKIKNKNTNVCTSKIFLLFLFSCRNPRQHTAVHFYPCGSFHFFVSMREKVQSDPDHGDQTVPFIYPSHYTAQSFFCLSYSSHIHHPNCRPCMQSHPLLKSSCILLTLASVYKGKYALYH